MIIVTGASDGLGAAIAREAALQSEAVLNVSRRPADNVTENLLADLATPQGIDCAVERILKVAAPKAIILNAGVLSIHDFSDMDEEEYERVMAINLKAPTLLLGRLYDWIRANEVDVVVVGSVAGLRGFKGQALYNISKWGLRGLTESLRQELDDTSCRVIGVYPGMLDTNMADKMPAGPLPKSKHATIPAIEVAKLIMQTIRQPRAMEVTDIVIERKK